MAIKELDPNDYDDSQMKKIEPIPEEDYDLKTEKELRETPSSWKDKIVSSAKAKAAQIKKDWAEQRRVQAEENKLYQQARKEAYMKAKVQAVRVRARIDAQREVLAPRAQGSAFGFTDGSGVSLGGGGSGVGGVKMYGPRAAKSGKGYDPIGGITVTGGSSAGGLGLGGGSLLGGGPVRVKPVKAKKRSVSPGITIKVSGASFGGLAKKAKRKKRR
jgi:hypothetical protein